MRMRPLLGAAISSGLAHCLPARHAVALLVQSWDRFHHKPPVAGSPKLLYLLREMSCGTLQVIGRQELQSRQHLSTKDEKKDENASTI